MTADLAALARAYGIATRYRGMSGEEVAVPAGTLQALIAAFGADGTAPPDETPAAGPELAAPPGVSCFMPGWLRGTRAWGVAAQLYQLRSDRGLGIGDFRDLADLARRAGRLGADFVGTNPLHALFLADPERASPFSPSSRRFLNPLYIALDAVPGHDRADVDPAARRAVAATAVVDYAAVGSLKVAALHRAFARFRAGAVADGAVLDRDFARFRAAGGAPLRDHALFEALSAHMAVAGHGAGWRSWPARFRDHGDPAVATFAADHEEHVVFHAWLQWLADRQLAEADAAAREAGMRIGLYLDLAVGTAPDGSATWSDPHLTLADARIGAPPDLFSVRGQDWGLAPLSPPALLARDLAPFREILSAVMARAGALRIDHAMALHRLYLIPEGATAETGTYVAMPLAGLLRILAELSRRHRTVLIGEDLGNVPEGFRAMMAKTELQSYRIVYFETQDGRFLPPGRYPRAAIACLSTHDLPGLAGWWRGVEIDRRLDLAMIDRDKAAAERAERAADRRALLDALRRQGLLPAAADPDGPLGRDLAAAVHRFAARTRSRLFAVRLEDLAGDADLVNLPGTDREHPNWRRKLPADTAGILATPLAGAILNAVREERPR